MMPNRRKGKGASGLAVTARQSLGHKYPQASQGSKYRLLQMITPLNTMQIMTNRLENSVDTCLVLTET